MTSETDDVVALWRLQARYADIVTRRAWPELAEVFRPATPIHLDTVTAPPRTITGPDELGRFVGEAIERYDTFHFVILNTIVDVTGADRAQGRMFMCEVRHDRESDTWPNAFGVYEDDYVALDGRWWFAERRYRSIVRAGPATQVLGMPDAFRPLFGH